jgi:hypothetical protein
MKHDPKKPLEWHINTVRNSLMTKEAVQALDHILDHLHARTEYLTHCASCGEGPSKTGFPRMDEDGLCACCGMDCSILGTVEAFRENEARVQDLEAKVVALQKELSALQLANPDY